MKKNDFRNIFTRSGSSARGTVDTGGRPDRRGSRAVAIVVVAALLLGVFSFATSRSGISLMSPVFGTGASRDALQAAPPPMSTPAAAASMESATNAAAGYGSDGAPQPQSPETAQQWDRKIIKSATLQVRVKDVDAGLDEVRSLAGAHGGYVTGSESSQDGEYTIATITLQVPSQEFDNAISRLRRIGIKVLHENITSSDVTEEFTDLESQLRNMQATEGRLLALMGRAERIEDILVLDRELRQIQAEVERIQGRLNFLSKRSEMSTISVSLIPEAVPVEPLVTQKQGWNPLQVAEQAWQASLEVLSGIGTALITVVVFMWWTIPLILLALIFLRRGRNTTATPTPAAVGDAQ